jgi:hypothetical protein
VCTNHQDLHDSSYTSKQSVCTTGHGLLLAYTGIAFLHSQALRRVTAEGVAKDHPPCACHQFHGSWKDAVGEWGGVGTRGSWRLETCHQGTEVGTQNYSRAG